MTVNDTILVRTEDRTAWVTLDRPPVNVMDIPMMRRLASVIAGLEGQTDFLVFQGAGPKAFSSGAEVRDHTPDRVAEMLDAFHRIFRQLAGSTMVTIAAVRGHCLGGGCELAAFCDFVVAGEQARFGLPEIKLGCFPPVAMVIFPQLVGPRVAVDLILTGRTITALEALQIGLVTRIVPDDHLSATVKELLAELRALSPAALRLARSGLRRQAGNDFENRLREVEKLYLQKLMKTNDAVEGIQAFIEKRVPVWQGR